MRLCGQYGAGNGDQQMGRAKDYRRMLDAGQAPLAERFLIAGVRRCDVETKGVANGRALPDFGALNRIREPRSAHALSPRRLALHTGPTRRTRES